MAYTGFDLTGKVALVTGGNGGIGFGMADAMAEAGADVCIWGTRKEKTDAAAEKPAAKKGVGARLKAAADRVRGKKDAGSPAPKSSTRAAGGRKVSTPRKAGGGS